MDSFWFDDFIKLCKLVGIRQDWVQAGGGNISVKNGDDMYIKASGCTLFEAGDAHWQTLDWKRIKWDVIKNSVSDLMTYAFDTDKEKPSIESAFHSLTDQFTVHIHPQSVIAAMACQKETLKKMFPDSLFIPYVKPGNELAYEIYKQASERKIYSEVIFLENHGIIVHGTSVQSILKKLNEVTDACSKLINVVDEENNSIEVSQMVEAVTCDYPYVIPLDCKVNFTNSCPDFIVYLNTKPFIQGEDDLEEYIDTYGEPSIIRFKNRDYIVARTYTKAKQIEDIVYANNYVNLFDIKSLPSSEISKIKNWDAEKYRKEI